MELGDIVGTNTTNKSGAEYNTEVFFEDNKDLYNTTKEELQQRSRALGFLAGGEETRHTE